MPLTVDEAIRVNTVLKGAPVLKDDPLIIATLNLNIEALKVYQKSQESGWYPPGYKLPGEAERGG